MRDDAPKDAIVVEHRLTSIEAALPPREFHALPVPTRKLDAPHQAGRRRELHHDCPIAGAGEMPQSIGLPAQSGIPFEGRGHGHLVGRRRQNEPAHVFPTAGAVGEPHHQFVESGRNALRAQQRLGILGADPLDEDLGRALALPIVHVLTQ